MLGSLVVPGVASSGKSMTGGDVIAGGEVVVDGGGAVVDGGEVVVDGGEVVVDGEETLQLSVHKSQLS